MAAKFNIDIKNIECSICLEIYKKPKFLSCYHSFCQVCLEEYVQKFGQGNTFPCPLCNRQIDIPKGGVSTFISNFYISDICETSTNLEQCSQHSLSLDIFCKSCNVCICSKCYMENHSEHKYLDLSSEELKKTTKQELNILKQKVELQLDDYIQTSKNLDSMMSELSETASSMCNKINIQSGKLCSNVTQSADELKENVNDWLEKEHERLQLKKHEIFTKQQSARLQSIQLDNNLEKPLVDIWPNLSKLKQEITKFNEEPKVQYIPVVRLSNYTEGEINSVNIKKQLGHFNIQDLPEQSLFNLVVGEVYNPTTKYNIKHVKQVRGVRCYSNVYYIKCDSPWQVGVSYVSDDTNNYVKCYIKLGVVYNSLFNNEVYCDIKLDGEYSKLYKVIKGDVTFKIINPVNSSRTLEETRRGVDLYSSGAFFGRGLYSYVELPIDYNILKDPNNGFLDGNGDFKVQFIVKITKLVEK